MTTTTFAERYQNGDHVAVWNDLTSLGDAVRHDLYYAEAVAVAKETMRRARYNVELIIRRLDAAGYRFIPPSEDYNPDLGASIDQMTAQITNRYGQSGVDVLPQVQAAAERFKQQAAAQIEKIAARRAARAAELAERLKKPPLETPQVFDPPNSRTEADLRKLEKAAGGPLPISLRAWYEQVGGVSLMGSHPVISPLNSPTCSDPLVICPLGELFQMLDMGEGEDGGLQLWLAPDDLHKANVSGGDPYIITVPNAAADAPFENECHETNFVPYLRKVFEWGGFPGWAHDGNPPLKEIAALKEGLLPL
jgi:hypothetical protein